MKKHCRTQSRSVHGLCAVLLCTLALCATFVGELEEPNLPTSAEQLGVIASSQPLPTASAGRSLFIGTQRFANGGPACASCHRTAGIPFPNGGTLGPDLSGAYDRFGPDALQVMLQTLYFPTMAPLFDKRPLTPQEQADLTVFFQQTASEPAPSVTAKIIVPAVGGFVLLLALAGTLWRKRLRHVRKSLVEQMQGRREARA